MKSIGRVFMHTCWYSIPITKDGNHLLDFNGRVEWSRWSIKTQHLMLQMITTINNTVHMPNDQRGYLFCARHQRLQMDQVVRCLKDEDIKMAKITHDFF